MQPEDYAGALSRGRLDRMPMPTKLPSASEHSRQISVSMVDVTADEVTSGFGVAVVGRDLGRFARRAGLLRRCGRPRRAARQTNDRPFRR